MTWEPVSQAPVTWARQQRTERRPVWNDTEAWRDDTIWRDDSAWVRLIERDAQFEGQ